MILLPLTRPKNVIGCQAFHWALKVCVGWYACTLHDRGGNAESMPGYID